MPFNSFTFVLFFAIVLVVHSLPLPWIVRKFNLLVASYLFYAAWDPRYIALLLFSTALNCIAAELIARWDERLQARLGALRISVLRNLGLLAAFKWGNELLIPRQLAGDLIGIAHSPPKMSCLLPIGRP